MKTIDFDDQVNRPNDRTSMQRQTERLHNPRKLCSIDQVRNHVRYTWMKLTEFRTTTDKVTSHTIGLYDKTTQYHAHSHSRPSHQIRSDLHGSLKHDVILHGTNHRHTLRTTISWRYDRMDHSVAIYPCFAPWSASPLAGNTGDAPDNVFLHDNDAWQTVLTACYPCTTDSPVYSLWEMLLSGQRYFDTEDDRLNSKRHTDDKE